MGEGENCYNCVYSHWDRNQAMWTMFVGVSTRPTCGNQPDFPGRMRACPAGPVCRNFRPRPPTPAGETVKTIPLGDGFYTYVDGADYEWLSQWVWCLYSGYAARREKGKLILMHREIMQPPEGMIVDHQNRNKLDNTRANLRVCTYRENALNRPKRRDAVSRFIGVRYNRGHGKWYVKIGFEGKPTHFGYYTDEVEAARAYDYKAVELFGEAARLNFPEEWPPERRREVHARWLQSEGKSKKEEGKKRKGKKKVKGGRPKAGTSGAKTKPARRKAKDAKRKAKGARRKTEKRK